MRKQRTYCVDFDDYCDAVADKSLLILDSIHTVTPDFCATLFCIPNRTSPENIEKVKEREWLALAPHGWEHTRGECLGWTDDEAAERISDARKLGIDAPIFRAPAWLLDGDVYEACRILAYSIASHHDYRIPDSGVPEYIYNSPQTKKKVIPLHGHLTDCGVSYIKDMTLEFPDNSKFVFAHDIAEVH